MEGDLIGTLPSVAHYPVNRRGERRRRGEKECIRATIATLSCHDTHLQVRVYPGTKQISECTILYQPEGEYETLGGEGKQIWPVFLVLTLPSCQEEEPQLPA